MKRCKTEFPEGLNIYLQLSIENFKYKKKNVDSFLNWIYNFIIEKIILPVTRLT